MTWLTLLYTGVLWFVVGALCALFSDRKGVVLAVVLPVVVRLFPFIFWVNPPGSPSPRFQWFRFGHELGGYLDHLIVPIAAAVGGALLVLSLRPDEEDG